MASLILAPTLKPRYMHRFLYSANLVITGAVVPLQISHRPQIRFFQCLTCPPSCSDLFAHRPNKQTMRRHRTGTRTVALQRRPLGS